MSSTSLSTAPKRGRSEALSIIDLCSPVSVKPCRNATPQMKGAPVEADQNRTDADDIAVALFDVDQSAPIGLAIDDDEYWEPEAYRSASGGCTQNSALPSSWPAFSSCRDENTPPLNGENDIIDLCSSQGSVEASSSCSAAVLFSAKRSSGPAAAVDLTQDCDDEPSEYYEESTQRDSVHIRETSLPGQTVPAVSLSKRVAAAPTLQSIVDTRPAAAEPSVRGSNSMAGEEIITRCSSILSVSAVSRRTQEDSGGEVVSEQHTLERSTRISITTKKTGGKTATTTKADGTTGSSRVRVSKAKALPSTTEEPVAVAPQAYTGSSNAAAPLPAIQSAFRSRFTEKTLLPLPTLTGGATWEVMLLIDQREKSNAQIQTQMAARCIPCRLATLAVGDFLWVVRPRGGTGVVGACSSSGAPVAVSAPVASQRSWTVTEEEEEDGDTRASAANGRVAGAEEEDDDEDRSFDTSNVFVLDCVAERKSINDLVSSLTDGRYIEQKNRLMACKLRSTMYIVEGDPTHVTARQKAITPLHIKNAMIALHVDHNIHVLRTRSMDHTITTLQNLHRQVENRFRRVHSAETSRYQAFREFQSVYGKKSASTQGQLFGHQLRQIQGCSTSVAVTLMDRYGTTARFMSELDTMGQAKAEHALANLMNQVTQKKLGPKLAQRLWQVYMTEY